VKALTDCFTKHLEDRTGAIASSSLLLVERRAYSNPAGQIHQLQPNLNVRPNNQHKVKVVENKHSAVEPPEHVLEQVHRLVRCQDRVGSWHEQGKETEETIHQDRRGPDQRNDRQGVKVIEREQKRKADTKDRCRVDIIERTQSLRAVSPHDTPTPSQPIEWLCFPQSNGLEPCQEGAVTRKHSKANVKAERKRKTSSVPPSVVPSTEPHTCSKMRANPSIGPQAAVDLTHS
jgi:hypothetical protein